MMTKILDVHIPPARTALTTADYIKSQIPAMSSQTDAYINGLIELCSESIAEYLNVSRDAQGRANIGRATYKEYLYNVSGRNVIYLSMLPIANINSVTEDGATVESHIGDPPAPNPAFKFITRSNVGALHKGDDRTLSIFSASSVRVVYEAGYILPSTDPSENVHRTLPRPIEDACVMYVQYKGDMFADGGDFTGPLTSASIEGVGSFNFEDVGSKKRGYGIPIEVRSMLDRYRRPICI